ncbi:MAG: sugar phosphate isomerase/epimerase [Saprospiraceae bacterium]
MTKSINRKEFIRLSTAAALSVPMWSLVSCNTGNQGSKEESGATTDSMDDTYASHPGLQLYTVRDLFSKDPEGTLSQLAGMGIKQLEFYDYNAIKTYVPKVNDLGMKVISTHFMPGFITGNWGDPSQGGMTPPENYGFEQLVEDCASHDIKYAGIAFLFPWDRTSLDDYKHIAEKANEAGELSKKSGVQLYYHNHSFEFAPMDGTTPFEEMIKIMDPELVKLELDLFWTKISGNDPAEMVSKHADRVIMMHLKDLKAGTPQDTQTMGVDPGAFQPVGDGVIDFKQVLTAAHAAHVPYAFIEQDQSPDRPVMESIQRSLDYLKELGL